MWHADEAETSMALSLYGDLVHMDLAIDGGGTPLVDPKWKMAPGEASHRWQFYGAEGTFALLEKDDLDYGVIGNPTKATKEKGDKLLVLSLIHISTFEARGYTAWDPTSFAFIKEGSLCIPTRCV